MRTRIAIVGLYLVLLVVLWPTWHATGLAPGADFLFSLAFGWPIYLQRVVPLLTVNVGGIVTAAGCLVAFGMGLHLFMEWYAKAVSRTDEPAEAPALVWPARRSLTILGLIVMMFVAGIAMLAIGHQSVWIATSPLVKSDGMKIGKSMPYEKPSP
jgi:hypothetical protein